MKRGSRVSLVLVVWKLRIITLQISRVCAPVLLLIERLLYTRSFLLWNQPQGRAVNVILLAGGCVGLKWHVTDSLGRLISVKERRLCSIYQLNKCNMLGSLDGASLWSLTNGRNCSSPTFPTTVLLTLQVTLFPSNRPNRFSYFLPDDGSRAELAKCYVFLTKIQWEISSIYQFNNTFIADIYIYIYISRVLC
jgi:hypothetical protein